MTREQFNTYYAQYQRPDELVLTPASDGRCWACFLGVPHTWDEHDERLSAGLDVRDQVSHTDKVNHD